MTLDEAIKHAEEVSLCETTCGAEHAQLATWLRELRDIRANAARYLAIRDYADAWAIEFTGNPEVMAGSGAMLDKIADEVIAARAQADTSNSI